MRIRKCASRVLGSAYFNAQPEATPPSQLPPPPPVPAAYGAANDGSSIATASEGPCELNRMPWELTSELDDPNPQDDPLENYFIHVGLVLSSVAVNQEDEEMEGEDKTGKKVVNKEKVARKMKQDGMKKMVKAKAKKEKAKEKKDEAKGKKEEEEASDGKQAKVWYCKKNDGKSWHCANFVDRPNALCDHHFAQSRSYYNPAFEKVAAAVAAASGAVSASSKSAPAKASASSKSVPAKASVKSAPDSAASSTKAVSSASALAMSKLRKRKKANGGSGMEYFYYAGWGPFRGKQRSDSNHREATADVKEERSPLEDKATPEARDDKKDDDEENDLSAQIVGRDEESDDNYVGSGKARAGNGKGKMAVEKARFPKMVRKRVKARSLKSLL